MTTLIRNFILNISVKIVINKTHFSNLMHFQDEIVFFFFKKNAQKKKLIKFYLYNLEFDDLFKKRKIIEVLEA